MNEECGHVEGELACEPIDTLHELFAFVRSPPAWRSLCAGLQPHSDRLIKNMEVNNRRAEDVSLERADAFCHVQEAPEDAPRRHAQRHLPKTLVCHDMANGYHDDSKINGSNAHDAYTFYNWAGVDIFCYFSHHLVTVPPLAWINVAHKHGVKVIGTVITEWGEGAEFWRCVLASEESARDAASALVAIARALRFEGWLLNVENKVSSPDKLVQFVRLLHRTLHAELGDGATLIWYDSVTVEGHLSWQNKLNDKNRAFFDACDGLFTNYSWTEEDVAASAAAAAAAAGEAGARRTDLFVGVDVWGRNFHGGGQLNTQEAVRLIYSYGCSMAIFAPAWTHEAAADAADGGRYERFLVRERALWDSLWPFLNTRVPSALPFQTSFCRGQGIKRRVYGEVLSPGPWYNLRHQQYQPNAAHGPHGYRLVAPAAGTLKLRESGKSESLTRSPSCGHELVPADGAGEELGGSNSDTADTEPDKPSLKHKIQDALLKCCSKTHETVLLAEEPEEEEEDKVPQSSATESARAAGAAGAARVSLALVPGERACLEPHFADSFTGGSCLRVHPSDSAAPENRTVRLLFSDFRCEGALVACVVTKPVAGHERQYLDVLLTGADNEGFGWKVTLVGRDVLAGGAGGAGAERAAPLRAGGPAFQRLQRYLVLHEPGFYVPVENAFGWDVRYYEVPCGVGGGGRAGAGAGAALRVTCVCLRAGLARGPALLGHFGLCARPAPRAPRPAPRAPRPTSPPHT